MICFNDLTHSEQRDFFNSIDVVMSDCDGVLWRGDTLPGCGDVINKFREMGKKVILISNNSLHPLEKMKERIKKTNIDNFPDKDIITPATTIVKFLQAESFRKKIYAICSKPLLAGLQQAGFQCDNGSNMVPNNIEEQLDLDPDVGAVVVDSDVTLNYMTISKAIHYLKRDDVLFIAGATDELHPINPTMTVLGPGHFLKLIAKASKRQPTVLGKPGLGLGEILTKQYSITDPKKVLLIGDSIEQDIFFAHKQGYRSLLVLTGITNMETAEAGVKMDLIANGRKAGVEIVRPEFYVQTLANIAPIWK